MKANQGFPGGSVSKKIYLQYRGPGFDPWVGKIPWRRAWQTTSVFLHGESPWTEKPDGLQSMELQRVGHDWVTKHSTILNCTLEDGKLCDVYFTTIRNFFNRKKTTLKWTWIHIFQCSLKGAIQGIFLNTGLPSLLSKLNHGHFPTCTKVKRRVKKFSGTHHLIIWFYSSLYKPSPMPSAPLHHNFFTPSIWQPHCRKWQNFFPYSLIVF